jgi:hypothetical protein
VSDHWELRQFQCLSHPPTVLTDEETTWDAPHHGCDGFQAWQPLPRQDMPSLPPNRKGQQPPLALPIDSWSTMDYVAGGN